MSWRGMRLWGMNAGMSSERQGDGGLVGWDNKRGTGV